METNNLSNWRWLRYSFSLTIPLASACSFLLEGGWSFLALVYAFGFLPLLEALMRPNGRNLTDLERAAVQADSRFDRWLWIMLVIQWGMFLWFLWMMWEDAPTGVTWWGRVTAMGLLCAVLGINVAHEMGHRPNPRASLGAYTLLFTSLYTHFQVEHNRGHHRNVATPDDPATARKGEWMWFFWIRAVFVAWAHAFELERDRLKRKGVSFWSWQNEVLRWQVIQWTAWLGVLVLLGWNVALAWLLAGAMGGLLLENVNYIEHYGLQRSRLNEHRYEPVRSVHSWNSNHPLGRLVLFELSRHSDHHAHAAKPFAQLDHLTDAPQLPTGYPGMMVLSWIPPLYFAVVHRHLDRLKLQG